MPIPREIDFRSQQDFRRQFIRGLLVIEKESYRVPKRRISRSILTLIIYQFVAISKLKWRKKNGAKHVKGGGFEDRPVKRVALAEIAANQKQEVSSHQSWYGFQQCDIYLCKFRRCFAIFHEL